MQSEQEGVFVPLLGSPEGRDVDPERLLKEHFTGPKWMGGCANGIDEESASFIDGLLHRMRETRFLTVDRSRLHDSHEAWVYVDIADQPLEPVTYGSATNLGLTDAGRDEKDSGHSHLPMPAILYMIFGFGASKGVLTWSNSD